VIHQSDSANSRVRAAKRSIVVMIGDGGIYLRVNDGGKIKNIALSNVRLYIRPLGWPLQPGSVIGRLLQSYPPVRRHNRTSIKERYFVAGSLTQGRSSANRKLRVTGERRAGQGPNILGKMTLLNQGTSFSKPIVSSWPSVRTRKITFGCTAVPY
jgi:hypothetical protein